MQHPVCDWCGHPHPLAALCTKRPLSRGVTRRSFIALFSAGIVGALAAPSLPDVKEYLYLHEGALHRAPLDLDAFARLVNGVWVSKVWPGVPVRGIAIPDLPGEWRKIALPVQVDGED